MLPLKWRVHTKINEIPISAWDEVNKKGSFTPLIKMGVMPKNIKDVWFNLQDQITERYGATPQYQEYVALVQKYISISAKFIKTDERYLLNEIERLRYDIEAKTTKTHPVELHKMLPLLTKHYRILINDKISVAEYYDLLKWLERWQKIK